MRVGGLPRLAWQQCRAGRGVCACQPFPLHLLSPLLPPCCTAGDGDVYVWGSNQQGQLGLGHRLLRSTPQLVEAISDSIVQVGRAQGGGGRERRVCWQQGLEAPPMSS